MVQEIANQIPVISSDALREIGSFADALALVADTYGNPVEVSELLSDGFARIEKDKIVGRAFVIVNYTLTESNEHFDSNGEATVFAVIRIVTERHEKLFFTDGSTGVRAQLQNLMERGVYGGVLCRNGLRVSKYEHTGEDGKATTAKTYYLNTDS